MIQISPDDNSINNNNHAIVITIPIVVVSILFVVALILAWKNYRTSLLKKDTANKKEEKKELPIKTVIISKEEPSSVMKTPRRSFASPRTKVIPGNGGNKSLTHSLLKLKNEISKENNEDLDLV